MKSTLLNMTAVLFGITLVASAGVGVVNMITIEPIAAAKAAATTAALSEVLPPFDETATEQMTIDELPITVYTATKDGEVSGYGNVVTIRSGDVGLLFAHMSSMAVHAGESVTAGQLVGRVGSTNSEGGFHTSGPHLHFEVLTPATNIDHALAHYSGTVPPRTDPQAWARANGVRLV